MCARRLRFSALVTALAATVGCSGGGYHPLPPPDFDGCPTYIGRQFEAVSEVRRELLYAVMETRSPEEARQTLLRFLVATQQDSPDGEVFCLVKTALYMAPGLRERNGASGAWRYWKAQVVVRPDCTLGAYYSTKRHLHDLILFARAQGNDSLVRSFERQEDLQDEIQTQIMDNKLCQGSYTVITDQAPEPGGRAEVTEEFQEL